MKNLFKKFSTLLSLVLIIAVSFISLTACSNSNKTASQVASTVETIEPISDSTTKEEIADQVSDKETTTSSNNEVVDTNESTSTVEENESKITNDINDISYGIYMFKNYNLTFDDIYYEDEAEIIKYFNTIDMNGVYDVVKKLGFDDYAKSITTSYISDEPYDVVVSLSKNESDGSELLLKPLIIEIKNSFIDIGNSILYTVEDGEIIIEDNSPEFLVNADGSLSLIFPFIYYSEENDITVYTPLYIKADLVLYDNVDIMDDSNLTGYSYVENSAIFESLTLFNETEAKETLSKLLNVEQDEIINRLSQFEFYFNEEHKLYICNTETNIIFTEKTDVSTYLLYDSCYLTISSEIYDITTETTYFNMSIKINDSVNFTFKIVKN